MNGSSEQWLHEKLIREADDRTVNFYVEVMVVRASILLLLDVIEISQISSSTKREKEG